MKILYVIQQSILNNDKKWLSADSNINMAAGLMRAWIAKNNLEDTQVTIAIAPLNTFADIETYDDVFPSHPNIDYFELPMTRSSALNRIDFNTQAWHNYIEPKGDYDCIICCVPEWILDIKTLYNVINKKMPTIIAQCFWMDTPMIGEPKFPENATMQYRQFEGFALSDLVAFTCRSVMDAWEENARKFVASSAVDDIMYKSTVWDFGYSQAEFDAFYGPLNTNTERVRIGFLNRITGDDYTHFAEFVAALNILKSDPKYADSFDVVLTNPSKRVSEEHLQSVVPNYVPANNGEPMNREQYLSLLFHCDVTVHLFTKERYGGCALRESIAAKNIVIVADCFEQSELVWDIDFRVPAYPVKPEDIAASMKTAIDTCLMRLLDADLIRSYDMQEWTQTTNRNKCSFESQIEIFLDDLVRIVVF